ncbi:hypothetical protein [Kineococcus gypseus]|uniref:hypothetical protein n=1 Tax=Kineococcus gypseus TaxID=1637102 RepID=UPI003D7EAC7E
MAVWTSFVNLVHLVGAVGSAALALGFAAGGQAGRAVFYGLLTLAFATALVRRRAQARPAAPAVVDLRTGRTAGVAAAPAAAGPAVADAGGLEAGPERPAA